MPARPIHISPSEIADEINRVVSADTTAAKAFALDAKADYGAVGDGAADDTAALQAWLDACKAGRRGFLPAGTYKITETLTFEQTMAWSLRGEAMGPSATGAATTLLWAGDTGGTMLLIQGCREGVLSDILLDGAKKAAIGLDYDAVSGGIVSSNNTIQRLRVYRCVDKAVRVAASHFQVDGTGWRDCGFYQGGTDSASGIGVSIEDANAVEHEFFNCSFSALSIGITAVDGGNGGHFTLNGCRFGANGTDIKPYSARSAAFVNCVSENSGYFLYSGASSAAASPTSLVGCAVNQTSRTDGTGVYWAAGSPLTMVGCTFVGTPAKPYKFQTQNPKTVITMIGCCFPNGNPFTGKADEYGPTYHLIGCMFATATTTGLPFTSGPLALGSAASPALTLGTDAATAGTARAAGMAWCKIASGTDLTAGANAFYVLSNLVGGLCAVRVPYITSYGGAETVLLGIEGADDNATTATAAKVIVRVSSDFTLTSDLIFAVRFDNLQVTY